MHSNFTKMSIANAYNSWAEQYDHNRNRTRDLDARATQETLAKYRFQTVLELGCGTGKNTQWLLRRAERIIGLDFSVGMLEKAREKIKAPNVEFRQADLNQEWEIKDQFADLVTSSLTLEHIEDLAHIFRQAHLKLKAGGRFFISELHPFKQYLGSKARFETETGTVELEVFTHHISDYLGQARQHGFELLELNEWFDESPEREIPRLLTLVFQKQ